MSDDARKKLSRMRKDVLVEFILESMVLRSPYHWRMLDRVNWDVQRRKRRAKVEAHFEKRDKLQDQFKSGELKDWQWLKRQDELDQEYEKLQAQGKKIDRLYERITSEVGDQC